MDQEMQTFLNETRPAVQQTLRALKTAIQKEWGGTPRNGVERLIFDKIAEIEAIYDTSQENLGAQGDVDDVS